MEFEHYWTKVTAEFEQKRLFVKPFHIPMYICYNRHGLEEKKRKNRFCGGALTFGQIKFFMKPN